MPVNFTIIRNFPSHRDDEAEGQRKGERRPILQYEREDEHRDGGDRRDDQEGEDEDPRGQRQFQPHHQYPSFGYQFVPRSSGVASSRFHSGQMRSTWRPSCPFSAGAYSSSVPQK